MIAPIKPQRHGRSGLPRSDLQGNPADSDRDAPPQDSMPTANPPVNRLALGAADAAEALGIGKRLLWSMTARREIPYTRLGRRVLYPVRELQDWLRSKVLQDARHD